ncbi:MULTISPECIES: efflux RND transporter periplasmic adaptor subunit [unclassified Streptococcus]|uniref:efflux RND transporter periplasmic adaptor subunit n=1 Tax=unclassified Streptococcus TaxID=2608887 RepID=UPI0011B6A236|nr:MULTISPECIES: efflux RND transporter periplasmic adaptor subunit [unclassified Streptococcus]TWS95377.1 efflux RND transporter periplasmic adaptor subunit [Streptococcus sp. sy018]TWT12132.1 efflux RND transporter periplasmic adaptor subunit [Streptococcus sp. sy004]
MSRKHRKKTSKKKKWGLVSLGLLGLIGFAGVTYFKNSQTSNVASDNLYKIANVKEGSLASATLLSGTVKALSEQYVYYDASKGTSATATVAVGDQVTEGQQLVQYDITKAQTDYDTAIRNLNKVARQIEYLRAYGNLPTTNTTTDPETGETYTMTTPPTMQATASYEQQLQDLNDAYANAQGEINKAQATLNESVITSTVSGTVVAVNNNIDPASKTSQSIVHVTSEGQLQVKGTLTEYDLANIKVGQAIKIKSKVYSDKEWTGTIASISNYPNPTESGSTNSTPTYNYTADITSDLGDLKQGFTVSVEVINDKKGFVVPIGALVVEGDKSYVWVYDENNGTVAKKEVSVGNADARSQEINTGLEVGQVVVTNPDNKLKDGQVLESVASEDTEGDAQADSEGGSSSEG